MNPSASINRIAPKRDETVLAIVVWPPKEYRNEAKCEAVRRVLAELSDPLKNITTKLSVKPSDGDAKCASKFARTSNFKQFLHLLIRSQVPLFIAGVNRAGAWT